MQISSNIDIDFNKWNEFLYFFFKDNNDNVYIHIEEDEKSIKVISKNNVDEIKVLCDKKIDNQIEIMAKTSLLKLYKINLPWGSLVGVRPTKLTRKLIEKFGYEESYNILKSIYLVSDNKIKILLETVKNSINYLDDKTIMVYIGHAFCPTKCSYCSFPAYLKKGKYEQRYDEYISSLYKEIEIIGKEIKNKKLKISSIYIGGGTPSYLSEEELLNMMKIIKKEYDFSYLKEFTFEAGRIDTITYEKLKILKEYGVDRISINPQSFKEETLKFVNRYHNLEKLNEVYDMSMEMGYIVNMDFIISLPKESEKDILNTIDYFCENYSPHNVTFHYLAMKNASYLTKSKFVVDNLNLKYINEYILDKMKEKGYIPYYLYRQKSSSSDGENMGFCKKGYQNIYNIEMIEENKSVIAIGAGSISKIIKKDKIQRLINPKDPLMWINELDKRMEEKIEIIRGLEIESN